eukprot:8350496-Karenia_brevis.AAC.1
MLQTGQVGGTSIQISNNKFGSAWQHAKLLQYCNNQIVSPGRIVWRDMAIRPTIQDGRNYAATFRQNDVVK